MDIKLNPGTFYFLGDEGNYIPVGDGTIGEVTDVPCDIPNEPMTISLSINEQFEMMGYMSNAAYMALTGIRNTILNLCPNKRVVHLAKYATKYKVRKKNLRRAIRILEV